MPVIVYGDFAVSPGPERRGGPPTDRVVKAGDMMILDFSVVIQGYRSDFTNTLVVGGKPNADQQRLYDLCMVAMAAGEKELRA
ncbi:M24 family metallopeptidase, partial [Klebsiella pneumoniae]|nr:M24 family metallopeptidase [Klebsiella pneumoniae]